MLDCEDIFYSDRIVGSHYGSWLTYRQPRPNLDDLCLGESASGVSDSPIAPGAEPRPQSLTRRGRVVLPLPIRNRVAASALNEIVDGPTSASKTFANEGGRNSSGPHSADQLDLAVLEAAVGMCLPEHDMISLLGRHVGHVVPMRTEPEMIGSDACRIVTTMTDVGIHRNSAIGQKVGQPVGLPWASVPSNSAVAPLVPTAIPDPAVIRTIALDGLGPKLFGGSFGAHSLIITKSAYGVKGPTNG